MRTTAQITACSLLLLAGCAATPNSEPTARRYSVEPLPAALPMASASSSASATSAATTTVQDSDAAAEMARKLQNPLANIKAVMTDNAIGFNTGQTSGTSFGFQIQPVYAIDFPDDGYTLIPRAVIPIVGLEPGTKVPPVGGPLPPGDSRVWGLGDTALQMFYAPHQDTKWKWGIGPQVSLPTHTDSKLKGADWGGGIAGVLTGDVNEQVSAAFIVGNMWAFDGSFSTALVQPMLYYNLEQLPGAYVAYNAPITANWKASGSDVLTLPLGATVGRAFDMGEGHGFDVAIGPYWNVARPDGSATWSVRFGLTWIMP